MKGLLIAGGIVGSIAAIGVISYISYANMGNRMEKQIIYSVENNENILSQYKQTIEESAQVPGMQTEDLVKIFTGTLTARYGANGSGAVMQWIKEQNPKLDQRTYITLQRQIEAGRKEFQQNQKLLVDARRQYDTALGNVWGGFWLGFAGYPKINLNDVKYKPISTDVAQEAFRTGKETGPTKLR